MSKLTNSRGSYKVNLLFHISYLFIVNHKTPFQTQIRVVINI
jgi:hypothetical protein